VNRVFATLTRAHSRWISQGRSSRFKSSPLNFFLMLLQMHQLIYDELLWIWGVGLYMTYTILYHELIRHRARLSHLLALHIANCHSLRIVLKHYFAVIGLCQVAHAIWTQNKEILFCLVAMFACLIPSRFYKLSLGHKFDRWRLTNRVNAHLRASFHPDWCEFHLHFIIVGSRFTWSW